MGDTVARDPDLAFPPVKQVAAFEIAGQTPCVEGVGSG